MDDFHALRPYLFSIAYRMLGSAMDAEDVLQDVYLRWANTDREAVRSPKAFLSTIVTRLSLNRLTSARAERETYVGVWLPEPLLTAADPNWSSPEADVGGKESVSMAFLLLLESLSPDERAVFVLRGVFDFEYAEIAETLGKSAAACRQLYHRAREKIAAARAAEHAPPDALMAIATAMSEAYTRGDVTALSELLAGDVVSMTDSGGKVRGAGLRVVRGQANVAAVLRAVFQRGIAIGATIEITEVNGQPGFVSRVSERIISVGVLELRDGLISRVMFVVNPDKLARINAAQG